MYSRYFLIALIGIALVACQPRRRSVEVPNNGDLPPGETTGGDFNVPDIDGGTTGDQSEDAFIRLEFVEAALDPHVENTSALTFSLKYLTTDETGPIAFTAGSSIITIRNLPIGQSGTMTLEIQESGEPKLRGSKDNVTLAPGRNNEEIDLQIVDSNGGGGTNGGGTNGGGTNGGGTNGGGTNGGGGDDDGGTNGGGGGEDTEGAVTIVITVGGDNGNDNDNDNGGDEDRLSFEADIRPIAQDFCTGAGCHAAAGDQSWWDARKSSIPDRISASASRPMPRPGSSQASGFSSADREKMLQWINQ